MLLSVSDSQSRDVIGTESRKARMFAAYDRQQGRASVRIPRSATTDLRRGQSGSGAGRASPEPSVAQRGARGRLRKQRIRDQIASIRWMRFPGYGLNDQGGQGQEAERGADQRTVRQVPGHPRRKRLKW